MKIIISPAKKMKEDYFNYDYDNLPKYLDKTEEILGVLKSLDYQKLKEIWSCNDEIAKINYERLENMDLKHNLTAAVASYVGLVFQNIGVNVLEESDIEYLRENLKILSGFYGILNAFDGIKPYRLEMQAKLEVKSAKNLYDFWSDSLYKELFKENDVVVNLASSEYSKSIQKYLKKDDKFVTIDFLTCSNGKYVQKATLAKEARGQMVRFMAENSVKTLDEIKKFNVFGYKYSENLSNDKKMVFIK